MPPAAVQPVTMTMREQTAPTFPRQDPRFIDHWIIDLVSHWGRWRRPRLVAPLALSGELCTAARDARACAERFGYVIEADRRLGYRVVDFYHPQKVYFVKPGRPPGKVAAQRSPYLPQDFCS